MTNSLAVSAQELDKFNTHTQLADFSIEPWLLREGRVSSHMLIGLPSFTDREARKLEQEILEVTQRLREILSTLKTYSPIDVEQDIWVQLPPIKEFTVKLKVEFLGRAKPDPLPAELLES